MPKLSLREKFQRGYVFDIERAVREGKSNCIKPTMKLFQSVALPKSLVPQAFLQKEKG